MPLENYVEPEVGVAAVVTAAVASPSLRKTIRRSAVYGLAGLLIAYDKTAEAVSATADGVKKGFDKAAESVSSFRKETVAEAVPAANTDTPPNS